MKLKFSKAFCRLRIAMDFLWMLTRVLVLVLAVMFTPDQVVLVWAYGHFLAGVLYVVGFYAAFGLVIKYGKNERSCSHGPAALPFSSVWQLLPARSSEGHFTIHPEYRYYRILSLCFICSFFISN